MFGESCVDMNFVNIECHASSHMSRNVMRFEGCALLASVFEEKTTSLILTSAISLLYSWLIVRAGMLFTLNSTINSPVQWLFIY